MEIKILEEHANPLLKRHEYRFEVAHATEATPSRDTVRGELSKLVKAPKDRVIIERMGARYGTATTRGDALVYDSADAAKSITRAHILVRNGLKEKEAKAGATPAPSPPAPSASPAVEPTKAEPPPEPKAEPKPEHKPEPKSEHKPEHKDKAESKAEHKPEHKGEHKTEEKSESGKPEHKGKAHKPEKTETPESEG